jgi:hypothetical protein
LHGNAALQPTATAHRLTGLFRTGAFIISLAKRKCRRPQRHRALDEKAEEVIRATTTDSDL